MQFAPFKKSAIEQSIPDRFSEQLRRHSDRIAILDRGQLMAYRELDDRSNLIAHVILEARSDIQEPVGILLEHGCAPIVVILAALKAGKIYVPMEPSDADEDLRRIVANCQPGLIITDSTHEPMARKLAQNKHACLNIDTIDTTASKPNPGVALSADSLAYIYYTSGSTGPPKGVFDCHRNVLHNVMRYTNKLHFVPNDRHSLIQSCSFSGTVSSIFSALLNGATLCPFNLRQQGISRLAQWLKSEQISIFHSVPTIFDQLLAVGAKFPDLRVVRLEGDQSLLRHARQFQERFGANCVLANGLGATETGLIRQFTVTPQTNIPGQSFPIGYDVEDMFVSLTNDDGCDVPQGEVGQITVRSSYLAKGYWQRPQQTADAFSSVPDMPEARIYRTGDEGRMLADGCLEYVGRVDFQAKIRGHRLDTAEIENVLQEHVSIERALVMVREDSPGSQLLIAYLLGTNQSRPTVGALRRFLSASLPTHQVPARFVFLDQFPLDKNGKLDRRALPAPDGKYLAIDRSYVAPMNFRQKVIADCFSDVLGVDKIGVHENFFDLGGDSLTATELFLSLSEKLSIPFSTELLLGEGTVAAIDRDIAKEIHPGCIVELQADGNLAPLFCMHDSNGHVLSFHELARLLGPERPVFGVQCYSTAHQPIDDVRLQAMAKRYVAEIQNVQPSGPYYVCGQCFGGLIAFEVAQQLRGLGEQVAMLALIDTRFPKGFFDLLMDSLTRAWQSLTASQLSATERSVHAIRLLGRFVLWSSKQVKIRLEHAKMRLLAMSHRSPDPALKDPRTTYRRIEHLYRPSAYDGSVALIGPNAPQDQLAWRSIGCHTLQVVEIPVASHTGDAPHLTHEPYVTTLAATLRELCNQTR